MKKPVLIFCEGVTDQVFVADCLEIFYNVQIRREKKPNDKISMTFDENSRIISIGGCGNLTMEINLNELRDNAEKGGVNLVIFDTDEQGTGNNSFNSATQKLEDIKKRHKGVFFDFYLWPNNSEDGTIESLLRQLVHPNRERVMNCIEEHQTCLKSTGFEDLRQVDLKTMMRYYLYTNKLDKTEGRDRDYKDTRFWNLHSNDIPDLEEFKKFLNCYFSPNPTDLT